MSKSAGTRCKGQVRIGVPFEWSAVETAGPRHMSSKLQIVYLAGRCVKGNQLTPGRKNLRNCNVTPHRTEVQNYPDVFVMICVLV